MVCPFDAVTQAQLRRIRPRGRWSARAQAWDFPLVAAESLQKLLGQRFPVTDSLEQWLRWSRQPLPPLPILAQIPAARPS